MHPDGNVPGRSHHLRRTRDRDVFTDDRRRIGYVDPMATCTLLHLVLASVVCGATWRHIAAVMPSALKDA